MVAGKKVRRDLEGKIVCRVVIGDNFLPQRNKKLIDE
jgi:hypothetical protein